MSEKSLEEELKADNFDLVLSEIPYLLNDSSSISNKEKSEKSLLELKSMLKNNSNVRGIIYTEMPSNIITDEKIIKEYGFGIVRKRYPRSPEKELNYINMYIINLKLSK